MPEALAEERNANSAENFEHVIRLLEDSRAGLEHVLTGLPDEFCSRKPMDSGWSITEVVEHLVIVEKRVPRLLQAKLPGQEFVSDLSNARERDAELIEQVASYTTKINAPDITKPIGHYQVCRQALNDFDAARQHTLDYAISATPYLRGRLLPHPLLGAIDGCQWLLALAAHTQRHIKQISEIKDALNHQPASLN